MSEWKTYRLGDIIQLKSGGTPDKSNPDYWGGSIPWISAKSMYDDFISTSDLFITEEGLQAGSKIAKKDSILLLTRGSGLFNRIPVCYVVSDVAYNQDVKNIVLKQENVTSIKFLYYWLYGNKELLSSMLETTGIGAGKIDTKRFLNLSISLPSQKEQARYIHLMDLLFDKIELNRRINANLEAQAQALFRSWFVDFEPFRDGPFVDSELGKIPQGWKICRLKDATKEIIRGFTSKYVEKSDLINLNQKVNKGQYLDRQYYKFLNPEIAIPTNKFAQQNDILLNSLGQGTLGRVHYYGELTPNIVIDQHITIIRANNTTFQPSFIYLFLSSNEVQHSIEGMVTGSTGMQMLNISQVREMNILQPDVNTMNKFHNIVQPFFVEIRKNNAETEIIAKIRDTLLPKLMAGEIKI